MVGLVVCFLAAALAATYALESSVADSGKNLEVAVSPGVTATWQESGADAFGYVRRGEHWRQRQVGSPGTLPVDGRPTGSPGRTAIRHEGGSLRSKTGV